MATDSVDGIAVGRCLGVGAARQKDRLVRKRLHAKSRSSRKFGRSSSTTSMTGSLDEANIVAKFLDPAIQLRIRAGKRTSSRFCEHKELVETAMAVTRFPPSLTAD